MTAGSPVSRRRRALVGTVVIAALAAGGGWWASAHITSPAQAAAAAAPPSPSVVTAAVELRVIEDSLVGRGTVAPARSVDVRLRAPSGTAGSPVVTAVHVVPGDEVQAGTVLLEVSGRPVITIQGDVPIYRDLTPGTSGKDVRQLQEALNSLGHPVGVDGSYGSSTTSAVKALYGELGFDPSPASPEDAEKVKAARTQVTAAERGAQDAQDGLDEAQTAAATAAAAAATAAATDSGGAANPASGDAGTSVARAKVALDRAGEDLRTARDELRTVQSSTGASVPASEILALPTFPAKVRQVDVTVGGTIPDVAMSLSTGDLQVSVPLEPQMAGLVREGQKVALTSEVLGQDATGTVARVEAATDAPQPAATGAASGDTGPRFVVTPDAPLPSEWNGQDVRVTIVAAASEGDVLVVPLSAVSADAQERTRVTVVGPRGAQTRVEVTPGVVGAGYVQVTPVPGQKDAGILTAGAQVVVGVTSAAGGAVPVPPATTNP